MVLSLPASREPIVYDGSPPTRSWWRYFQELSGAIANLAGTLTGTLAVVDTSSGPQNYSLPANPADDTLVTIKDNGNAAANNITIQGNGNLIDGQPTFVLRNNWSSARFVFESGQWYVI